ncbi:hypothetical protein EJ05DRAFT_506764 [Pseudovirgaria hyperparasitica]|uniref:C2H2-type domain-containing protein n=1 Tax=Pseudovirgaria hyperparasitica TaxID=470096 RepID=A0A6A6WLW0_9PEZI|nr:uncharacterized protein EJ05DRAFT_506764 [Pseudovirgaria hyperparasitica]KAF2763136.1 hypothetical protein EJ05DRAFT_506764 [Pseudovirgaria hyperparasitica]
MQRSILFQITILLLAQMASASPHDTGDLSQLPNAETGSFYEDPEGLLAGAVCHFCGFAYEFCRCNYTPNTFRWSDLLDPTELLNHPAWPSSYLDNSNETALQNNQFVDPPRPRLIIPQTEAFNNNNLSTEYPEASIDGILSSTYNAGDRLSPQSAKSSRRPREQNGYSCDICRSTFDRECDLNRHKKIHLDNHRRPIKCPDCDKGFLYPKDLKRHQSTHTASERTFFCPVAGCKSNANGFTRKDNYKRHMRSKHSRSTLDTASVSGTSTT